MIIAARISPTPVKVPATVGVFWRNLYCRSGASFVGILWSYYFALTDDEVPFGCLLESD